MRKIGLSVIVVLALVFTLSPVAAFAAKKALPEIVYFIDEFGYFAKSTGDEFQSEQVWPISYNQGDVSISKDGRIISFWTYVPIGEEDTWPITIVDLTAGQSYPTEISGSPVLNDDGTLMAVRTYGQVPVSLGGTLWMIWVINVDIYNISNPENPIYLDTVPTLSTEENVDYPSWGPDNCLYVAVADYYISDLSPEYWGAIVKYNLATKKRSWIVTQNDSNFFNPQVTWDGKKIVYGCDRLNGEPIWSTVYARNLKGNTNSLGEVICNDYGFNVGNGQYLYMDRDLYIEGHYVYSYIAKVNIETLEETLVDFGWNGCLAIK